MIYTSHCDMQNARANVLRHNEISEKDPPGKKTHKILVKVFHF
jgi:hypothetical protein